MKLYEINEQIREALEAADNAIDPETGEVDAQIMWKLEKLELQREDKLEAIAIYVKETKAEAEAITAELKTLQNRKRVAENKTESLKRYLASQLKDGEKIKTARCSISWRKSESVLIDELSFDWNNEQLICVKKEVDKIFVKDALKAGAIIAGAVLVEKNNLQIK